MRSIIKGVKEYFKVCEEMDELDKKLDTPGYNYPADTIRFHELNLQRGVFVRQGVRMYFIILGIVISTFFIIVSSSIRDIFIGVAVLLFIYLAWRFFSKGSEQVDEMIRGLIFWHRNNAR